MRAPARTAAPAYAGPRPPFDLGFLLPRPFLPMGVPRGGEARGPGRSGHARTEARILADLEAVERERSTRAADAALGRRVQALKTYQQRRFQASYADLLADRRHAKAVRFFVDQLHGPQDFAGREAQIAVLVPTLVRMFPREVVDTVAAMVALLALSESLDTDMARHLRSGALTRQRYVAAWQATGRAADRQRQIALTLAVARQLEGHTRDPLLGSSLRMMRGPALLAGLGELQHFLESGFDAFAAMRGAARFLSAIERREAALHAALAGDGDADDHALSALPQGM